jgi:hypothetical protein
MIKDIMVIPCDDCKGAGFLYFGDDNTYDVESCDCVDENDELVLDWNE